MALDPLDFDHWQEKDFAGKTRYRRHRLDGIPCVLAESHGTASGLFLEKSIDIKRFPILKWQWRIDHSLGNIDETQKQFDDYAARIYVVVSGGLLFWKTRALNYVWANRHPVGEHWPNAFTNNAVMLAVATGDHQASQWQQVTRNVRQDLETFLGIKTERIDAIAIMSDSDNTGKAVQACYGAITFNAIEVTE